MLKSVERLLEFVGDMNATEINDHIKGRLDGIAVSFGIDGEWLDGWNRAVLATVEKIEKEVSERYMELPLDADGVPVRVGDVVEAGFYGTQEIAGVSGENSDFPYVFFFPDDGTEAQWCEAQDCHHHAPTVEDVLREMVAAYMDTPLDDSNDGEFFAEYAQRLQLREVDDD